MNNRTEAGVESMGYTITFAGEPAQSGMSPEASEFVPRAEREIQSIVEDGCDAASLGSSLDKVLQEATAPLQARVHQLALQMELQQLQQEQLGQQQQHQQLELLLQDRDAKIAQLEKEVKELGLQAVKDQDLMIERYD